MTRAAAVVVSTLLAAQAAADAPRLTNGRLEQTSAAAGFEATVRALIQKSTAPTWIGWAVATDRPRESCCWGSWHDGGCCSGCRLEGKEGAAAQGHGTREDASVKLEAGREMHVLVRAEKGAPTKIRTFSPGCGLDAGGTTLHWLEGVAAQDSVRFLAGFLDAAGDAREPRRLANHTLAALAFHAAPEAVAVLIDRARTAPSGHVRGQALFWLAQRAGEQAVGAIARALEEDPETDVKKKAVFALGQLPRDEGVPLLIQTARTNRNPAVRKQAFFWLGQSKDPRALDFFETVLK